MATARSRRFLLLLAGALVPAFIVPVLANGRFGAAPLLAESRAASPAVAAAPPAGAAKTADLPPAVASGERVAPLPPLGDRVGFSLDFKGEVSSYRLMSTFLLPGERLELRAHTPASPAYEAFASAGELRAIGPAAWSWIAPQRGVHTIIVRSQASGDEMQLNAVVMVPYDGGEQINGYRIGRYPARPLRNDPAYLPPTGFVELREDNLDLQLSPHFRLGQFACKQPGPFPKYLVVKERLLLNLEALLESLGERGIMLDTFSFISAFRTPAYNALIGNDTVYSRHGYGDAADIFVDRDGDGVMDDLDGDGRLTAADARVLFDLAEALQTSDARLEGGLGLYGPKPHRGPFVHVDTRGFRARW